MDTNTRQTTRLGAELNLFDGHKAEWLEQHRGSYVVIKGENVLNFYSTFEDAYRAGAERWGTDTDFLVKQIVEQEPVFFVF